MLKAEPGLNFIKKMHVKFSGEIGPWWVLFGIWERANERGLSELTIQNKFSGIFE